MTGSSYLIARTLDDVTRGQVLSVKRTGSNDSRVLVRVREPRDEQGVSVLVTDDAAKRQVQYQAYSPKFKRVRRVTGESVFGTIITSDFTYDDFAYFYRVDAREQIERKDDAVLDGFPIYVLESTKDDDDAQYSLVRFFIDQKLCLPVRTEFYAQNGALRKELTVEEVEIDPELPDTTFEVQSQVRGGH